MLPQASEEDLLVVEALLKSRLATGAASFHAQQCVEKSLKAVLEEYTKRVPKIHDLDKLFFEVKNYVDIEYDGKFSISQGEQCFSYYFKKLCVVT